MEKHICPECKKEVNVLVIGGYYDQEQPEATCYYCSDKWMEKARNNRK